MVRSPKLKSCGLAFLEPRPPRRRRTTVVDRLDAGLADPDSLQAMEAELPEMSMEKGRKASLVPGTLLRPKASDAVWRIPLHDFQSRAFQQPCP